MNKFPFILHSSAFILALAVAGSSLGGQEAFPAPPADRTLIYLVNGGAVEALPFETGTTTLKTDAVARSDKTSYIELKGARAGLQIDETLPRFYLFVADVANVHPPFIVRLTEKRGARRVTAMAQKGFSGFAIYSEEIIKPRLRVLGREGGLLYMEIRPRESLLPGEYAIIGTDLQRIATFRIAGASNR